MGTRRFPSPTSSPGKTLETVIRPSYEGSSEPDCKSCPLQLKHGRGINTQFFVKADLRAGKPMLVGEAGGRAEVAQGMGFVGEAGQELWRILGAMGMTRDDFSVTNVLKCQPPNNKFQAGGVKAVRACSAALRAELAISRPPFVIALGSEAMKALTGVKGGITELRGQKLALIQREGALCDVPLPVFPTFHPSYLVRTKDPGIEEAIVDDLMRALDGKPVEVEGKRVGWTLASARDLQGEWVLDTESFLVGEERLIGGVRLDYGNNGVELWEKRISTLPPDLSATTKLIMHFARHDYCLLRRAGLISEDWPGRIEDTILKAQLLDENRPSYFLKTWAQDFGYGHYWKEAHAYWDRHEDPPTDVLLPYCATDVALTRDLNQKLEGDLDQSPGLRRLHDRVLVPCLKLLAECELNGIQISPRVVEGGARIKKRLRYHKQRILEAIVEHGLDAALAFAGFPDYERKLNGRLFKEELMGSQLPRLLGKKYLTEQQTPTGKLALHKQALAEMSKVDTTGIVESYRRREVYLTQAKLLKQLLPHRGSLIHPKFNLGGKGRKESAEGSPVTGRLSAQDPNTQQFPPWMRKYVVSRYPKGVILKWDAKQLELRVAYEYSRDPALLQDHQEMADFLSKMFGRKFTRDEGKTGNFAGIFGAEEPRLMQEFGIDQEQAHLFHNAIRERLPIHFEWIAQIRRFVKEHGYVESLCGRVRRLPLARGGSRGQSHALKQATNHPIQCFANTLNLLCALYVGPRPRGGNLINLVHDEGNLDCESRVAALALGKRIKGYWRSQLAQDVKRLLGVDLVTQYDVDILIGPSWGELEQIA